jgi:hypothetical protein
MALYSIKSHLGSGKPYLQMNDGKSLTTTVSKHPTLPLVIPLNDVHAPATSKPNLPPVMPILLRNFPLMIYQIPLPMTIPSLTTLILFPLPKRNYRPQTLVHYSKPIRLIPLPTRLNPNLIDMSISLTNKQMKLSH